MPIQITGKHNTAEVFTDNVEASAVTQIIELCNQPCFENSKIRIMPDVHAGKGCTIGTTMTITDKVVPNMVGVDIGCGMYTVRLAEDEIDFAKLDEVIREHIPCGGEVRDTEHPFNAKIDLAQLRCDEVQLSRARLSIGTLGGGNHFIEVARSSKDYLYLIIHSGSRHLGTEIANWYQQEGFKTLCGNSKLQIDELIAELKRTGRSKDIQKTVMRAKAFSKPPVPESMAYVEGKLFDDYIHDMQLTQAFAALNRKAMANVIMSEMGLCPLDAFTTVHNYIDTESMILRKGAVSARDGEKLLIPINMRDGSLLCRGKGNPNWNYSAPHGAGRLMSRGEAKRQLSLDEFQNEMSDVFTTSVGLSTLDEAPMAYKSMTDIIANIEPTVEMLRILKPVYNFKASDG